MAKTVLTVEPLARKSFQPYGWVVDRPSSSSNEDYPIPTHANQGTALRYGNITSLTTRYHETQDTAQPVLSLFSCSPRSINASDSMLRVEVLEKHPYTSQTFAPLGLDASDATYFLVIVAPTLKPASQDAPALPDLRRLKAFRANGSQAVTYAAGTWHAPMVVIGQKTVDFLVIQWMNSIPDDNCQEVHLNDYSEIILVPTNAASDAATSVKAKL